MPAGQEDGIIHPRYGKHLESRYGGTSRFPIHPLPSILEIEAIVSKAKNDACSVLQQLGVLVDGVSQFTFDSRLFIHLSSSTISVDEQDELEEICHEEVDEEEDDVDGHDIDLLNTLSQIDFKDFTNKVEHSTFMSRRIEEGNGPFVQILGPQKQIRYVKKSTIVWFFESGMKKMSNDRTQRFLQMSNLAHRKPLIVREIGKQKVRPGDWCIFRAQRGDKKHLDGLDFLLGRVISFQKLKGSKSDRS